MANINLEEPVSLVFQRFSRLLSAYLTERLGSLVHVYLSLVDEVTFHEYTLASAGSLLPVMKADQGDLIVFDFCYRLAYRMIDSLLGGNGAEPSSLRTSRGLSQAEVAVLRPHIEEITQIVNRTLKWVRNTPYRLDEIVRDPTWLDVLPPDEVCNVITLEVHYGESEDLIIEACLPRKDAESYMQATGGPPVATASFAREDAVDVGYAEATEAISASPLLFLNEIDATRLLSLVADEHPQIIALVLSCIEPSLAAALLSTLPPELQPDVVTRILRSGHPDLDSIKSLDAALRESISRQDSRLPPTKQGTDVALAMLKQTNRTTLGFVIESIEENAPELAEQIRRRLFLFEDIASLDDEAIRKVLKEADATDLNYALRAVNNEVRARIFANMSRQAVKRLRRAMEAVGAVRMGEVETAQARIRDIMERLEKAGEIVIAP